MANRAQIATNNSALVAMIADEVREDSSISFVVKKREMFNKIKYVNLM
jgi:hypothetical protein